MEENMKICPIMSVARVAPCIEGKCQLWDYGIPNIRDSGCGLVKEKNRE
jgi:hypothetical protein